MEMKWKVRTEFHDFKGNGDGSSGPGRFFSHCFSFSNLHSRGNLLKASFSFLFHLVLEILPKFIKLTSQNLALIWLPSLQMKNLTHLSKIFLNFTWNLFFYEIFSRHILTITFIYFSIALFVDLSKTSTCLHFNSPLIF